MRQRAAVAVAAAAVLCGMVLPVAAQQIKVDKENRTIAVTTSAEATAEADSAIVHVGFLTYGQDEQSAYAAGSETSNAIAKALAAGGVPKEAIQSDSQSIQPVPEYGQQNWTPEEKVKRKFQVQQSWSVKTAAKDAARVLDAAVKAGANQSGQIEWTVKDEDGLQAKAAGLALERAKAIARQMAAGLGAGLGSLLYASNEAPAREPLPLRSFAAAPMAMAKREVEPLAINPRKVSRSATVYAVFAIE